MYKQNFQKTHNRLALSSLTDLLLKESRSEHEQHNRPVTDSTINTHSHTLVFYHWIWQRRWLNGVWWQWAMYRSLESSCLVTQL